MVPSRIFRPFQVVGIVCLLIYLSWNVTWLANSKFPPSLFLGATGLPGPTTGCTRSMTALFNGNISGYFAFNPMALPISILIVSIIGKLAVDGARRQPLRVSPFLYHPLFTCIAIAWMVVLIRGVG